jgi:S-formylglutathione hydrolase FrmB
MSLPRIKRTTGAWLGALIGLASLAAGNVAAMQRARSIHRATTHALAPCTAHWVGSWAASPSDASVDQPLVRQTVRMIIAPHLAGGAVRIHLSNRFGTSPVRLGPVTVATAGSGATVQAGSIRAVSFGGQRTVTIPAGGEIVSDATGFPVVPFRDVEVSVAVPELVAEPTEHFFTRQESYMTPPGSGDHTGDIDGTDFVLPTTQAYSHGWYFLDGLDVQAPGATGTVSTFGDSITDGFQGLYTVGSEDLRNMGDNGRYPDDLARRLLAAEIPLSVLNAGIGSNQLLHDAGPPGNGGPSGLSRFTADVLDRPGVTDVIVLDGINDLSQNPPATAAQVIAGLERLVAMAHARGIRIQLGTITPAGGVENPNWNPKVGEPAREAINTWVRTQRVADGVVDFDAAVRDPADPTRIDPRYDGSDHLHFNALGYRAMASAVSLSALARPSCGTAASTARIAPHGSPISVVSKQQLDPRLTEYRLRTPALKSPTPLRVLLPGGYASHPDTRYPVLYLLHGCCNYGGSGAASWTTSGDAEAATAKQPLIVVMPDDGEGGMYTDWYNDAAGGDPKWETYDIDQLIPWIDSNFRTITARRGRAIAGLSMGGFGAISYAARHPDLFAFAASFSGIVDNHDSLGDFQTFDEGLAAQDGGIPGSAWGPYATDSIRWEAHNPVDLASNLQGLKLELRTGDGTPGGPYGGGPDPIELTAHRENVVLNQTLDGLGIPHVWDDYGAGAHAWAYWDHDLEETLPDVMATFADPPPPPAPVNFTAVEPSYETYGWQVAVNRQALEFSTLSVASRRGFALSGSGNATVTTPAIVAPNASAQITITTHTGSTTTQRLRADGRGRLLIHVPLGPPNAEQEGLPGAVTRVYRTSVSIQP